MGKTDTIKRRAIYVYLPSLGQKARWEECARAQGVSVSKFVVAHVENSISQVEDASYQSMGDLWREIKDLREQLAKVAKEKHILEVAIERLEEELRRYRAQPFLEDGFVGVRSYQKELVELLKEGRTVGSQEILSRLRIKPTEEDAVKAVSRQLENLENYGIVKSSSKGWRWTLK